MNFITKRIRQIFFMNRLQRRIIASVLTICMVFGFMQMPGLSHSARAEESILTSTVTKITLNGSELTDETVVKNGDVLKIEFDWALANTNHETTTFEVNLNLLENHNIQLMASGKSDLMDNSGNIVGYYKVEDGGILKIVLEDNTFLNKDGRKGGVTIQGKVNVDNSDLEDGDEVVIGLGEKEYRPVYNTGVTESGISARKEASGSLYQAEGKFKQDFTLDVYAYSGTVSNISVADTYEAALGEPTGLKIVSSTAAGIAANETFASIADLNAYLSGKTMDANTSFKVSYTQEVDHTKNGTKNTASVTYKNNKNKDKTVETFAYANVRDPEVSKTGVLTGEGTGVVWTVTVRLNDYALMGDLDAVVQSLLDTPGEGMKNLSTEDIKSKMTGSDGVYTYTYTAPISDAYLESPSTVTVKNAVKMTMTDNTEYSTTGSVTIVPDGNWLTKTVNSYNESTKILKWDVNIGPIPSGVTDIKVSDAINNPWASNSGKLSLQWGMSVDGHEVIDSNGHKTADFDTYLSGYNEHWVGDPLVLNNDYVATHNNIKVTFTTRVEDETLIGKVYNNRAQVSYTDPVLGTTHTITADGQYKQTGNLVTKDGAPVSGKNAARYRVKMYLAGYEMTAGENIVVTEQFPTDMIYNPGTADLKATVQDPWGNAKLNCAVTYDSANKTFTVPVTNEIKNMISTDNPYLIVEYTLYVDDEAEFVMNGEKTFTNNASVEYEGTPIGHDSAAVTLTPQKIVSKTGDYSLETAPYVEYTVYINESKLDLLPDPGTLTATDTLGSALSYDKESIVVSKNEGGTWVDLAGSEYQYTYNLANNSLVFKGLPDATWLRITYRARVNIAYGEELTPENSTNSIALEGGTSDAVKASKGFSVVAVKPDGWATSEEGEIKLYKFWTNDGQMVALKDSVFKVLKMKYDPATNSMVEDIGNEGDVDWNNGSALLEDNIRVGENGYVTIDGLSYSRVYALVETAAPTGYAVATEPYYFVLAGSDAVLPPADSGIKVTSFSSGSTLYFENQKSDVGTLEVTKSLAGVESADVSSMLSKLTFTVKKDGTVISGGTFSGNTMTLSGGVYKKTFANLAAGDYTVTESMADAAGYVYKSSSYQVTVGASAGSSTDYTPGTAIAAEVAAGTTKVDITNTYAKTASLLVKKTVGGDVDWSDIKNGIVFKVYDKADMGTPIATIQGSEMSADGAGYSKRVDGLDPSKTYVVVESGAVLADYTKTTTWKIGAGSETESALAEVTTGDVVLAAGGSETVEFHNDYEVHKGTLKLTKKVTFDIAGKAWDDVKGSLKFSVKCVETGDVLPDITGIQMTDTDSDGIYEYTFPNPVPVGTYEVTETVTDITGMIVSTTYTVTTGGGSSSETGRVATVEVENESESTVAYVNNYKTKYATLVLKKTVSGDLSWDDIKDKIHFSITGPDALHSWEIDGTDSRFTSAGDGTYVLSIENIEEAGKYVIKETFASENAVDYTRTTKVNVDGGALQDGEIITIDDFNVPQGATVQFYNDYERNVGNLVLKKTIEGVSVADLEAAADRVTFVVTPSPVDNQANKAYKLSDFSENVDGSYTLTISNVKTGNYHVKETVYELDGYDTKSVEYTLTTALGATSTVAGGKDNGADVTVATDRSSTVAVADAYTKHTGNLEITKKVSGARAWNDVKEKLSFRVTNAETGYDETFTHQDFADADGDGIYLCKITNVPIGTYTVTETLEDVAGYASTTTYQIGAGGAQVGKEAELSLAYKGQTVHVGFVNDYRSLVGSILLKKSVTGDQTWEQVRDTLSFVVLDENGDVERTVNGSQLQGPDADGNYFYSIDGITGGTYTIKEVVTGENVVAYTRTTTVKVDDGKAASGLQNKFVFDSNVGATAVIENSYKRNEGQLVLHKTLAGIESADLAAAESAIKFTVTPSPTGEGTQKEYALSEFVKAADGTYALKILNVPTGTYHVKETAYAVGGYDIASVDYTVESSGATSDVANGKDNGANVTVVSGKATGVTVSDAYTKTPTDGTLIITKTIEGDVTREEYMGALTFKVTNVVTGDTETYTLSAFEYDEVTNKYTLELPLVAGGYKVEETTRDIDGYEVTVTHVVDGGAQTDGWFANTDITVGGTSRVDFKNDYRKLVGNLKLDKSVEVGGALSQEAYAKVKDKLEFLITGPNGYSQVVKVKDLPYTNGDTGFSHTITDIPVGVYTIEEMVRGVPGYVYVATVNDGGTDPLKATVTVPDYVSTGTTASVAYTNKYDEVDTGKIVIQKTLKGDITKEEAEGALQFTVTNEDTKEVDVYTLKDFVKQADGTYLLELDANVGDYTVEETIYDVNGYITDSVKYSVNGAAMTDGSEARTAVTKDTTTTVAFADAYTKDEGKLVITKTIKGDVTKEEAEGALQFKVTDTAKGTSKVYTLKDFTYDAKTGTYKLELTLPSGTYTVEETIYDIKGYITSSVKYKVGTGAYAAGTSASAKLEAGGSINVDFEDVYEKNIGKLVLTKSVQGDLIWDDVKDSLSFVVKNKATGVSKTYKASDFADPEADGVYTLIIDGLEPGEYTVTENLKDVKGYLLETTYRIDGGSKQIGTEASVKLTKDGLQLDFVNTYKSTKGKLQITKTLLGNIKRKDAEKALKFKVTNLKTDKSKTYTLKDFTYDKEKEVYVLELTLEGGKYKVTETEYDVKGYELRSVTYKIGDGEKTEGGSAKVKVKAGKTTKVAFVDRYIKKKTSDRTDTTSTDTNTNTTGTTTDRETPKTGDESPLALWLAMMLLGAFGIGGSVYGLRKNRKR